MSDDAACGAWIVGVVFVLGVAAGAGLLYLGLALGPEAAIAGMYCVVALYWLHFWGMA